LGKESCTAGPGWSRSFGGVGEKANGALSCSVMSSIVRQEGEDVAAGSRSGWPELGIRDGGICDSRDDVVGEHKLPATYPVSDAFPNFANVVSPCSVGRCIS